MIKTLLLLKHLRSKKGVEFSMGMLAAIIIIVIALVIFLLFLTGSWSRLVGIFGGLEDSALANVPK